MNLPDCQYYILAPKLTLERKNTEMIARNTVNILKEKNTSKEPPLKTTYPATQKDDSPLNFNITCTEHKALLFDDLIRSFGEEEFTDITLMAEGKEIKAHRLIISAYSPYLKVSYDFLMKNFSKFQNHWSSICFFNSC